VRTHNTSAVAAPLAYVSVLCWRRRSTALPLLKSSSDEMDAWQVATDSLTIELYFHIKLMTTCSLTAIISTKLTNFSLNMYICHGPCFRKIIHLMIFKTIMKLTLLKHKFYVLRRPQQPSSA